MDQCTREVRAEYWKKIIQACGQRPAGQSAKSWMDENGICEQSYYHWQRRFRKQAYEEMKGNRTSEETNTYMVSDKLDLRKGIDGLATIIGDKYGQNPFEKGTLFLFCGKRSDRCKGLLWMGTGFLLLYKRFEAGMMQSHLENPIFPKVDIRILVTYVTEKNDEPCRSTDWHLPRISVILLL